jgi:hypothetical protein
VQKQTLGQILRSARLETSGNIAAVAAETKIRPEFIEALEADKYHKFSSEVHLKGFIKNYARHLNLDYEKLLAVYRRDIAMQFEATNHHEQTSPKRKLFNTITTHKLALSVAVVVLFTIFAGSAFLSNTFQPPKWKLTAPLELTAPFSGQVVVNNNSVTFAGELTDLGVLRLNGDVVSLNSLNQFNTDNIALRDGDNLFVLTLTNNLGRTNEIRLIVTKPSADMPQTAPSQQSLTSNDNQP